MLSVHSRRDIIIRNSNSCRTGDIHPIGHIVLHWLLAPRKLPLKTIFRLTAIWPYRKWNAGVPAAIKLAQGYMKPKAATATCSKRSNNHFGIKCKTNWTGETVYHDDDALGECFRKYPSAEDSYRDHSNFLKAAADTPFCSTSNLPITRLGLWPQTRRLYATNPPLSADHH